MRSKACAFHSRLFFIENSKKTKSINIMNRQNNLLKNMTLISGRPARSVKSTVSLLILVITNSVLVVTTAVRMEDLEISKDIASIWGSADAVPKDIASIWASDWDWLRGELGISPAIPSEGQQSSTTSKRKERSESFNKILLEEEAGVTGGGKKILSGNSSPPMRRKRRNKKVGTSTLLPGDGEKLGVVVDDVPSTEPPVISKSEEEFDILQMAAEFDARISRPQGENQGDGSGSGGNSIHNFDNPGNTSRQLNPAAKDFRPSFLTIPPPPMDLGSDDEGDESLTSTVTTKFSENVLSPNSTTVEDGSSEISEEKHEITSSPMDNKAAEQMFYEQLYGEGVGHDPWLQSKGPNPAFVASFFSTTGHEPTSSSDSEEPLQNRQNYATAMKGTVTQYHFF